MFLKRKLKKIDESKIETAIGDFEAAVDFELVPVISERSCYTEHISWVISLILGVTFVSIIDISLQDSWASRTIFYVVAAVLAVVLGRVLDKAHIIERFFISKAERNRQVFEKAQRIFFLKRLNETKSHHALLLYISIMERKIIILPDPNMKLESLKPMQERLLALVQQAFAKGEYEKGFLDAIQYLKTELASKFPQKQQQPENQLSNKLIWWTV